MKATTWLALGFLGILALPCPARAGSKTDSYWNVDDLRPGMKGHGQTVMRGTRLETFDAEVLGVLKNTSPGRDMVLCRLSGLNLEKTGVIAGMSGSPVYVQGKLMGAVAYAWAFGTEPIAGVTPFSQMRDFVEAFERRDLAEQKKPTRVGLLTPFQIQGRTIDAVTVAQDLDQAQPMSADDFCMVPLRAPLAASGFTPHALALLRDRLRGTGIVPMSGGAAPAHVSEQEMKTPLQAGGPLAVALILGDFDLSGIGTVTHIEGNRVYGWGHPYMGLGACEFPLMTGYIHTIYPRQSVSFKMGSPLRSVGVINADVSTGIAGWLGREPDMIPARIHVRGCGAEQPRTFNVQVVRQRSLLPTLLYTALTNSVDMEGELPEELTAEMKARIEVEGHEPIIIHDTYSGASYSGGRAPQSLYMQIANLVNILVYNPYKPIRITRFECETKITPGRRSAEIEAVELATEVYAPGETVKANVFVRPYKGSLQRVPVSLKLPADFPEGTYHAILCDDLTNSRQSLRDQPNLANPQTVDEVFANLQIQTSARRTNLVLRVPMPAGGVALEGKSLPHLPASMVHILGQSRRTGPQLFGSALVARQPTMWVVQGSETVTFAVSKSKRESGVD